MLCAGQEMIVYGRVKPYGKKLSIVHPDFEIIREGDDQSIHLNRIVPVYSGRMGIAVRRLREIVWEALARLSPGSGTGDLRVCAGHPVQNGVEGPPFSGDRRKCATGPGGGLRWRSAWRSS